MKQPKIDSFKSARTLHPEDVSMPKTARPIQRKTDPSSKPNGSTERANGDAERSGRTRSNSEEMSVIQEMHQGVDDTNHRPTERYSFEIYTDQKQKIRDLQYQYEKRTGRRLSASRIIREAIAVYLKQALELESG